MATHASATHARTIGNARSNVTQTKRRTATTTKRAAFDAKRGDEMKATSFDATRVESLATCARIAVEAADKAKRGELAIARAGGDAPVVRSAASDVLANWKGAKLKPLGYSVLSGLLLWLIPAPAGVTTQAWHLLAVFVATIVGIITNPLPLGAVAMIGLGVSMTTGLLPFSAAFSAVQGAI